ncbi:MAG TPA: HPr family phosphocarrier protein [Acidobacteriota bacterium]|nr:HPr family phosphocarrier protein [Acidobacteriota bacterium]
MVVRTATIVNKLGLHARPCAQLVSTAAKYDSVVHFTKDELRVNGKSIMGVMMLAAERGSAIKVEAEGPDEEQAVADLVQVIESGFGEEI